MLRHSRSAILCGAATLAIAASINQPASAQDICVICTEPSAVYRCQLDSGAPTTPPHQLHCMQQLAKEGAHATCAVRRGVTGSACDGPIRTVTAPPLPATTSGDPPVPRLSGPATSPLPANPAEPPATVAEAARRAKAGTDAQFKQAQDQLRTSTEKTGGALKRGWDCVASFFKHCGSE